MKIELFGIARARAGTESVVVSAPTLREALQALARACPGLVPEVVENGLLTKHFVASQNGDRFLKNPDAILAAGDTLLILGAQAGG